MLPHLYWALGGTALLGMVMPSAPNLPQWRSINAIGTVMLTVAGLVALVMPRVSRTSPLRWPFLAFALLGTSLGVAHGIYGMTLRTLQVAGVQPVPNGPFDASTHAWVLWDLLAIEPWFTIEGVLFAMLGYHFLESSKARHRWVGLCVLGIVVALASALLGLRVA